jgi:hypothetical protein
MSGTVPGQTGQGQGEPGGGRIQLYGGPSTFRRYRRCLHEQQGSRVTERDILTTLSDNSLAWVYFNVPQARYLEYLAGPGQVKEGKIELMLAKGNKFKQTGKIGAIEAQFNNDNGAIPFRADSPNPAASRYDRHRLSTER